MCTSLITVRVFLPWESVYITASPVWKVGREGGRGAGGGAEVWGRGEGRVVVPLVEVSRFPKASSMERVWMGGREAGGQGGVKRTMPGGNLAG